MHQEATTWIYRPQYTDGIYRPQYTDGRDFAEHFDSLMTNIEHELISPFNFIIHVRPGMLGMFFLEYQVHMSSLIQCHTVLLLINKTISFWKFSYVLSSYVLLNRITTIKYMHNACMDVMKSRRFICIFYLQLEIVLSNVMTDQKKQLIPRMCLYCFE